MFEIIYIIIYLEFEDEDTNLEISSTTAAVALPRTTSLSHTPVQLNDAFAQPISVMAPADTTIPPITHTYTPQTEPSLVLS